MGLPNPVKSHGLEEREDEVDWLQVVSILVWSSRVNSNAKEFVETMTVFNFAPGWLHCLVYSTYGSYSYVETNVSESINRQYK